jgi:hypothetical protein
MDSRILLVCVSILFISTSVNAQRVSRREEPILVGSNGQSMPISWTPPAQPLSGFGYWNTSGNDMTPNGPVFTISGNKQSFGQIVVGGSFDSIGNLPMNNIALTDVQQYNAGWQSLGSGVRGGAVYCTLMNDTQIFAGGSFDTAGGVMANRIAMWDGTNWHSLGAGNANGLDSTVLAMAVMGDSLYVGGNFTHAGGLIANHIAIWNLKTEEWETITEDGVTGVDGGVAALLAGDTILYAGGGFQHAADILASKIAQLSRGKWNSLGNGVEDTDGVIECLTPKGSIVSNGHFSQFFVGGRFSKIADTAATDIAMWSIFSNSWSSTGDNRFLNAHGTVYSIASGVGTYVGGDFMLPDFSEYFLTFDGMGNFGSGIDGPAFAVFDLSLGLSLIHSKSDQPLDGYYDFVVIGGGFETAGGFHTPHFARWTEGADVAESKTIAAVPLTSFPNPVEQGGILSFTLNGRDHIVLTLFDELGRKITTLADRDYDAGTHEIPFQRGANDGTGILLGVLKTGNAVSTCKVVLK